MNTKRSLLFSIVSLILCVAMLAGTTFAWFTDSVTSGYNKIVSGSLRIDLELLDKKTGEWNSLKESKAPIFNYDNWEPGYIDAKILKVENEGTLALKWKAKIVSEEALSALSNVIDVYVKAYGVLADDSTVAYPADRSLEGYTKVGTVAQFVNSISETTYGNLLAGESAYLGIALKMQESAGNEYQKMELGAFDIQILATQLTSESDSYGSDYDAGAQWPVLAPGQTFTATTPVTPNAEGKVGSATTIGDTNGDIYANVPADVLMADGANALTLNVNALTGTASNVTATHRSEVVRSVDVHIDGVSADNDVPMVITLNAILPTGLNSNNVKLYHVENGVTVEMDLVATPTNHNEFSYDPLTGNVVLSIASFSEIVAYGDTKSEWDGVTVATAFNGGIGTEGAPYIIANAEQFVYFRNEVDGGRTFEGQFVKLTANLDLNDVNFDPIGYGYDYDGFMADGKTFNGTFDGGNHIIYGLRQNGWEANDCGNKYDYSMAGGGLFASVCDATIKNLTISGADIVMECIDMGVVVGYAQGNCTFDNIAIVNCTIQNYNRYTGGVVGECSPRYAADGTPMHSNHVFNNIRVDSTTTVSSLWGSFDTSLGGILGGKWDKNGAETKVTMSNCHVACTIDAFNDVTSAYQWYAYRRAGMLIGNTEQSADHKALANFLTCENVYVYYGEWNDYHYCEFTNQSGSDDAAWQNNYPWVRVESGLSCNAYSNPRYGHPIVNGTAIVDSIHSHVGEDECMISLPFKQLYGGGQGVYGATEHINADGTNGVSEGAYTVTYINYDETLKVEFVGDNSTAHTLWNAEEYVYGATKAISWVDGNGKEVSSIDPYNVKNYIVYPKFQGEYTIRFFDAEGNVVYYETFKEKAAHTLNNSAIEEARLAIQNKVDASGKVIVVSWDRTNLNTISKSEATKDITVKAVYTLSTSSITLTPVEENGVVVSYKVTDANKTVENVLITIPARVGTIPVEEVSGGAFDGFDNLHAVTIPTTITYIGANALASDWSNGTFGSDKGESMTIYYAGSYEEWCNKIELADGWSDGVSASTRIFFLNGTDTVDFKQGYLQFVVDDSNWLGAVKKGHFEYVNVVPDNFVDEYYANCDCSVDGCKGNLRPDAKYWAAYVN